MVYVQLGISTYVLVLTFGGHRNGVFDSGGGDYFNLRLRKCWNLNDNGWLGRR